VHGRVQRDTAQQPRCGISQPIRRPRVRRFVHRQGKQQNQEKKKDLNEIDIRQGTAQRTTRFGCGPITRICAAAPLVGQRGRERPAPPKPVSFAILEDYDKGESLAEMEADSTT
jgi:hypothetical protein